MSSLIEFLEARIADEERRVDVIPDWYCTESARGEGWGSRGDQCELCAWYMHDGTEVATEEAWWSHYEDVHRRQFVLAECAAKRQIIALHPVSEMTDHREWGCTCGFSVHTGQTCLGCGYWLEDEGEYDRGIHGRACPTLAALAAPYASHPDFDPSWAGGTQP